MGRRVLTVFFSFLLLAQPVFGVPRALPSLNVDAKAVTISGISSGAFMAVQMHVAYSSLFSGVASIAGGIYWCAQGSANTGFVECMSAPTEITCKGLGCFFGPQLFSIATTRS